MEQSGKYKNFIRIPAEDQKRILDACLEEFALHGFQQASTNAIVTKAGIPKGTLFYFFGSKKNLYLYLLDRAIVRYTEVMNESSGELPGDLFERMLHNGQLRMRFVIREPLLYKFFYSAFVNAPPEIQAELESRAPNFAAGSMQALLKDLDLKKFKESVDVQKAIQLVFLVLGGIFTRYLPQLTRLDAADSLQLVDQITDEVKENFELLKRGLYK
jgi:TetR/AcrR family transcriptional regulator